MNQHDNTPKSKPAVYYAQSKPEPKSRDFNKKSPNDRAGGSARKGKPNRKPYGESASSESRIETFSPKRERPAGHKKPGDRVQPQSPWQAQVRKQPQQPSYAESAKSVSDDAAMMRKQRQQETYIYSENSCQAIFKQRPDAIVKAFLTESMTTKFRDMVMWLAEHRLGYDVVSDEQLTKMTGTPHHGGVALIVKKRHTLSVLDYLAGAKGRAEDCVLAVDDVNNPHNLGALMRSAAFFSVNGMILRQPDVLESGAAMRVAEGGSEYVQPIKADDLVVTLSQLKKHDYRIVAILPCNIKAIEATSLYDVAMRDKTVFVLFQQINKALIKVADDVVYLPGSPAMAALNISVATGVVLSHWQNR